MRSDYDFYRIGCRYWEVKPLSPWRFQVCLAKFQQMQRWEMEDWRSLPEASRLRTVTRWSRLRSLIALIRQGRELAARSARPGDEEGGLDGTGDREPRVPLQPLLPGYAARSLPVPAAPLRTELWS